MGRFAPLARGLPALAGSQLPEPQGAQHPGTHRSSGAGDGRSAPQCSGGTWSKQRRLWRCELPMAHYRRGTGAGGALPQPGDSAHCQIQLARRQPPLPRPNRAPGGAHGQPQRLNAVHRQDPPQQLAPEHPARHQPYPAGRRTPGPRPSADLAQTRCPGGLLPALFCRTPSGGGGPESPCRGERPIGDRGKPVARSGFRHLARAPSRRAAGGSAASRHLLAQCRPGLAGQGLRTRWLSGPLSRPGTHPREAAGL